MKKMWYIAGVVDEVGNITMRYKNILRVQSLVAACSANEVELFLLIKLWVTGGLKYTEKY